MASITNPNSQLDSQSTDQKPLIVIYRIPSFSSRLNDRLALSFSILDPISAAGDDPSALRDFLRSNGSGAHALIWEGPSPPLGKDILDCLPSLKCVAGTGVGTDHIDLSECRRRGICVTNSGESFSDDTADCAVGLLLDVLRKISASDRFIRAGSWPERGEYPLGSKLGGKRVGIVGLGSIGWQVAKRLLLFGCSIAYNSRQKKASVPFPFYDNIYNLALDSDVLILCCSLTDQTYHLIKEDVLTPLGKEGIIINVGRGALVVEQVLVQFLVQGKLAGAGLDVFEDEPNVPKELFGLDNVVLSPHNAVITPESLNAADNNVIANLEAFFSNRPLLTPIRWE